MNAETAHALAVESSQARCSLRHQRLEKLEELAAKTATAVHAHGQQIMYLEERVTGLAHAHEATLVAVRASTDASERLSATLERVDGRLDGLLTDYGRHVVDAERDKRTWPRLALWIWGSSIVAGCAVLSWIVHYWPAIDAFLKTEIPLR